MAMLAFSQMLSLVLLLLLLASSPAVLAASNDEGLIHIRLFVHETLAGRNATVTPLTASPFGANSSFGSIGVVDDDLRVGPDRSSQLLGRFQGFIFGTSRGGGMVSADFLSSVTLVFTAGEYAGSTLSVEGPLLGSKAINERPVVGGTGKFRLARGYSLTKTAGKTSPKTDAFQFDVFVLMHNGKY